MADLYPQHPCVLSFDRFEAAWKPGEVGIYASGHSVLVCDGENHTIIREGGQRESRGLCKQWRGIDGKEDPLVHIQNRRSDE